MQGSVEKLQGVMGQTTNVRRYVSMLWCWTVCNHSFLNRATSQPGEVYRQRPNAERTAGKAHKCGDGRVGAGVWRCNAGTGAAGGVRAAHGHPGIQPRPFQGVHSHQNCGALPGVLVFCSDCLERAPTDAWSCAAALVALSMSVLCQTGKKRPCAHSLIRRYSDSVRW